MLPEIGHLALWLALALALAQVLVPTIGILRKDKILIESGVYFATGQFCLVLLSYIFLTWAFLDNDFSVAYVATNSNTDLPIQYKISAVWGAHEGSFLLWILIMSGWTLAVARSRRCPDIYIHARILVVMGVIACGFMLFSLLTSNPFARLLPLVPGSGHDLNPQLQDIGLIFHPPMLYLGYVGFSVPFAFAIAVLWKNEMPHMWTRWIRPWANAAWAFLGAGIILGSWWAYYELGWGGWWFWDAVENVSFIPWLAGTALIHSLAATEKRGVFKSWSLLLALSAFSLSLIGAFIVRSGILTSVHSFAVNPERGVFLLGFLIFVTGGALLLYALRAPSIASKKDYTWWSREFFLLINNLLLVVSLSTILFGTLFPLIYESLSGGEKISVGKPWFDAVFIPLVLIVAVFMAVGPIAFWKRTSFLTLIKYLRWNLLASLVLGILLPLVVTGKLMFMASLVVFLAAWVVLSLAQDLLRRWHSGVPLQSLGCAYFGMVAAHLGFVVCLLGVSFTSSYSTEKNLLMQPGKAVNIQGYEFTFMGAKRRQGPNYQADIGTFKVRSDFGSWMMYPEKRHYPVRAQSMTEAAIDPGFMRDIYVVMGEPRGAGSWSVRIHYKPFIRWVWFGGLLMILGGILALFDKRYGNRDDVAVKTEDSENSSP